MNEVFIEVVKYNRAAQEEVVQQIRTEFADGERPDFLEVNKVLRFLYPKAVAIRFTIM